MPTPETPPFNSWAQLVLFLVAVGAVGRWIWSFAKDLRQKRNGRSNGDSPLATARISVLLEQLERTAATQGTTIAGLNTSIAALNATLTLLGERLTNMPTKLDLMEAFAASRHDLRNIVAPIPLIVETAIEKVLTEAEATLRRRNQDPP